MAKATRATVEKLIEAIVLREVPAVRGRLKVEFDRRYTFQYEAKRVPKVGVMLTVSVSPTDKETFFSVLRRASNAVAELHYRTTIVNTVRGFRPPSRAIVRLENAPSIFEIRNLEDVEWIAMWAHRNGGPE